MQTKLIKFPWIVVLLFVLNAAASADEIAFINGSRVKGTIQSATSQNIHMTNHDASNVEIPRDSIDYIIFSDSDEVVTYTLEKIQCKILDDNNSRIMIIDENSIRYIPHNEVLTKSFNTSGKLKIQTLPATGPAFHPSHKKTFSGSRKKYGASLTTGLLAVDAERWRDDFFYYDAAMYPMVGIRFEYAFREKINLFSGYQISLNPQKANHKYESIIQLHFGFIGGEYSLPIDLIPNTQVVSQLTAGAAYIKGDAWTYSYRLFNLSEFTYTLTPGIGIRSFFTNEFSANVHLGYTISPAVNLEPVAACGKEYSLSFSGFTASIGFSYYFDHVDIGKSK